jgi:hypothetical protein
MESVESEDFGEFEEVSHAAGTFEVLVEGTFGTDDIHVFPEFLAEGRNLFESGLEAGFVTGHAHVFPHDVAEFAMELVHRAVAVNVQEMWRAFFVKCATFETVDSRK